MNNKILLSGGTQQAASWYTCLHSFSDFTYPLFHFSKDLLHYLGKRVLLTLYRELISSTLRRYLKERFEFWSLKCALVTKFDGPNKGKFLAPLISNLEVNLHASRWESLEYRAQGDAKRLLKRQCLCCADVCMLFWTVVDRREQYVAVPTFVCCS